MTDWTAVCLRFAIYADLALLFGMPVQLLRQGMPPAPGTRRLLVALAATGLLVSALALLSLTASMAGTALLAVDRATLQMVALQTPPGIAFLLRFAALALALALAAAFAPGRRGLTAVAVAAGAALATLAWAGHGAMDDGARGWLHLGADILHLLAAAGWVGAIAALLASLVGGGMDAPRLRRAQASLAGFARAGSVLVATLIVTGAVNGALLLGSQGIRTLPFTLYGRLLLLKLILFGVMLALAAANRWRFTPRLEAALLRGNHPAAARALRRSLACEFALVLGILALVGWLGTLAPLPD